MQTEVKLVAMLLTAVAVGMVWAGYQVIYKGRTNLIRLGSGPLPGAALLSRKFGMLFAWSGLACAAATCVLLITNTFQPAMWLLMVSSLAIAIRRHLLVSAIEKHSEAK